MENKHRNEMEVEIAGVKVLLRPTFENIAAMESDIGGLAYLGWKFSRGVRMENGKAVMNDDAVKCMPTMSEITKIFYYNQAEKKYSLEDMWDLVISEGVSLVRPATVFLARVSSGDKNREDVEPEKKS